MSITERYIAYALAFREAFASDDWTVVEPFFTEDAEYVVPLDPPMGGYFRGRDSILAYFKDILDRLDRRFESREGAIIEGPREEGDTVWIRGRLTYRATGVPDAIVEMEETAQFRGGRICRLEDHYDEETKGKMRAYTAAYGKKLGIDIGA